MDVPRTAVIRLRRRRQVFYGLLASALIVLTSIGLTKLKPAAPSVERSTMWIESVQRGPLVRQVHGLGILAPEEIRWIATNNEARVEKILVRPGSPVKADTVIVILSNATVEQQAFDAEWKLRAEEAQYHNVEMNLQSQVLDQKANTAKAAQEAEEARMKADADVEMAKDGIISDQTLKISVGNSRQLVVRADIERQRYDNAQKAAQAQLAAEKAKVEQVRAVYNLQQKQRDMLQVRAGMDGILQELSLNGDTLQEGQQVPAGTTIAKVANPKKLKAELKIPETQAKDVQLGQSAEIDTRNGLIEGKVMRIDPSVQNGTRTVDVSLIGNLPQGAVPDLSVEGTVDLERAINVLFVSRPTYGQENTTIGLYKVDADGKTASRVQVTLGRSSAKSVQILRGLKEGDQVILSDMSRWDQFDHVRLQ